jgi:hypothetical protein
LKLVALALLPDELPDDDEPDGPDVLLPHAAATSASAPRAAMAGTVCLTDYLLFQGGCPPPHLPARPRGRLIQGQLAPSAGPPVSPQFRPVLGAFGRSQTSRSGMPAG